MRIAPVAALLTLTFAGACPGPDDPPPKPDAGAADAGDPGDAGTPADAGADIDAGAPDAGTLDAGAPDAGAPDAGDPDAGDPDAGASDAGALDDAGEAPDAGGDAGEPACTDGATQPGMTACGHNGRGMLEQACVDGAWGDSATCLDPDQCADGATEDRACGLNDNGTETRSCASGSWGAYGGCVDPDVCVNGATDEEACGEDGIQVRTCAGGSWGEPGPCTEPVVAWLYPSSQLVSAGDSVTLTWTSRNAVSCQLDPGALLASPAASGSVAVTVQANTTFTLTCENAAGTTQHSVDVRVSDTDWADVAAGGEHSCGLKTDGRLFCWGSSSDGQIGNNRLSTYVYTPGREASQATDWVQLAAGGKHTCALKSDGRLFCWGDGFFGQLGVDAGDVSQPVQEGTQATDWAQVSTGHMHTCAVKTDGRLFCWGNGNHGRLGNNSTSHSAAPVQEHLPASDWAQVAAGTEHTCAVKGDGRLFCWGRGSHGRLGNDATADSLVPVQEHTAASDWAQVATGGGHSCALKSDGRLFCWGSGSSGQLGNNAVANSLVPVQEHSLATDWVRVRAGSSHTCALKADGRLFCWGSGGSGKLGDNQTDLRLVPTEAQEAGWARVALGTYHTCGVRTDGRLFCFGDSGEGRLGDNSLAHRMVPVQGEAGWAKVTSGQYHTCALKGDGRLFCWGYGLHGQLGHDAHASSSTPVQEHTQATDWADVSTGDVHTCAVKGDGRLFCFGEGDSGRLGTGSTSDATTPAQEQTLATDWTQVSAGSLHTCAVKEDGRLFCWGEGAGGRLGTGATSGSTSPVQEQTQATDWAQVSAGYRHTCAVKGDGRLFCWGDGASGRLGTGATSGSLVPAQEQTLATDWAYVAAGREHTCAVKTDGRVFCWGEGFFGALGHDGRTDSSTPVQEDTGASDWVDVSAGNGFSCGVQSDGRLLYWGAGSSGQLAVTTTTFVLAPVQEHTGARDWVQASAGQHHSCALKSDGRLFCWGLNGTGVLGVGPWFAPVWPAN